MTIRLTTGILALGLMAGSARGQNTNIIQSTHDTMKAIQSTQQSESDAALGNIAQATPNSGGHSASVKTVSHKKASAAKSTVTVDNGSQASAGTSTAPVKRSINFTGKRDPFVSPVVSQSLLGSGCCVGKRCLAIDSIALKGVVRSENGMIAVVVNSLDKAYFLRENDPVFNGYVVKITGDSVVFKENVQDRLGKPFTREITKKITTPAV